MKTRATRQRRVQACNESPAEYKGARLGANDKIDYISYLQAEFQRIKGRSEPGLSGPVRILFKDGKAANQ